jgi:hypothetical protein
MSILSVSALTGSMFQDILAAIVPVVPKGILQGRIEMM